MKPHMEPIDLSAHVIAQTSALDEETARAEIYGLVSQLFYAPPAPSMLADLRLAATQAPAPGGFLEEPWRQLVGVARDLDDLSIQSEFDALFGGVGKPEVYLFGSHYLSGFLNEKPLARLRSDLAGLGLTRDEEMPETEDHIAYLCEVMRFLIAGDDVALSNLATQKEFFSTHLQPWVAQMTESVAAHPKAHFYAALASFFAAFIGIETQGFDMLDA
jgi:TorA maturation chaperone TorD